MYNSGCNRSSSNGSFNSDIHMNLWILAMIGSKKYNFEVVEAKTC